MTTNEDMTALIAEAAAHIENTLLSIGTEESAVRDAALAAVERVRAIHQKRGASWPHNGGTYVCDADNKLWPCPTIAALEGAPEPECGNDRQTRDLHEVVSIAGKLRAAGLLVSGARTSLSISLQLSPRN